VTSKNKLSIDRFNVRQMFNNSEGKTSGMLFVCTFGCFSAVMCFVVVGNIIAGAAVYSVLYKENLSELLRVDIQALLNNLLVMALALFGMAGAGLGIRRFTPDKHVLTEADETKTI
jgi:hypothetical protein